MTEILFKVVEATEGGPTARGENLDISWLKDENASNFDELPEPEVIAAMIRERLATAMEEKDALTELLEPSNQ